MNSILEEEMNLEKKPYGIHKKNRMRKQKKRSIAMEKMILKSRLWKYTECLE